MTTVLIAESWVIEDLFHLYWWNSLIASAAKIPQCTYILSEDFQHSQNFKEIRVINPFRIRPDEL
jgi:predicted nucleic acid-binding protein